MQKDVEMDQDYETIPLGYIKQTKSLVESINRKDREIRGIKKLKELNQSSESLKIIDSELNEADEKKHILVTQLSAIRESTNEEFAYRRKIKSNQITNLEANIKHTYADVEKYNETSIELSQTQNEHISIIQNHIEFEKILADQSKDKDLQDKAGTHLYHLYNDELGLQEKRLEALEEKNKLIKLNSHLHDKESNEKQLYESSADIKSCNGRILFLRNEIEIKEKAFQNEDVERITIGNLAADDAYSKSSEDEINPLYISPTRSELESKRLKQQIQNLDRLNIKTYKQIQDQQLSSKERAILSGELEENELSQKKKWDRLAELEAELEKEKHDALVVDPNVKPQHVESIPKLTEEQGAVPKKKFISGPVSVPTQQQKELENFLKAKPKKDKLLEKSSEEKQGAVPKKTPNADKPATKSVAKFQENSDRISDLIQKQKKLEEERLKASKIAFRDKLNQTLQAKQAMQGTSTFFVSDNSSTSGDQTKTLKLPTRKQFSR